MKKKLISFLAAAVVAVGAFTAPAQTVMGSVSAVSEAASTVSAPTASRKSGTYVSSGSMKLTFSCKTSGAKIYYSLNGGSYKVYTKALSLKKNSTIKVYAAKNGAKSTTKTYTYKFYPKVTITPAAGEYDSEQTVRISATASGVKFYYTLDGTKPTTSSTLYTAKGIPVTETARLRVVAVKSGWTNRYFSRDYTIKIAAAETPSVGTGSLLDDYTAKYGYSVLTAAQREAYGRMFKACAAHEDFFDVSDLELSKDDVETVYWAFDYDNGQFFWLSNGYGYMYSGNWILGIYTEYSRTKSEADEIAKKFNAVSAEILAEAEKCSSDYDKLKVIHDWIVNNTTYNADGPDYKSEADGPILHGTGLCEGYSKAFMYLAQSAGIPTICVSGTANGGGHMWNMVYLDGQWYHVDVTWDDPISREPVLRYDYFLISDSTISKSHHFQNWIEMPSAPSDYVA